MEVPISKIQILIFKKKIIEFQLHKNLLVLKVAQNKIKSIDFYKIKTKQKKKIYIFLPHNKKEEISNLSTKIV